MNTFGINRYRAVQFSTLPTVDILNLLYDGLLRFLAEASLAMSENNRARAGERLTRSHAILEELAASLDYKSSPELCHRLLGVFDFCMRRIIEANLTQDTTKIDDVDRALRPIAEAWRLTSRPKSSAPC